MNKVTTFFRNTAVSAVALGASVAAFADAVPLPSAAAQISEITAGQSAYATVMFGLALAAVGILVGVKWIKRGRGAA